MAPFPGKARRYYDGVTAQALDVRCGEHVELVISRAQGVDVVGAGRSARSRSWR